VVIDNASATARCQLAADSHYPSRRAMVQRKLGVKRADGVQLVKNITSCAGRELGGRSGQKRLPAALKAQPIHGAATVPIKTMPAEHTPSAKAEARGTRIGLASSSERYR
jgi:hypothetical protein